MNEILKLLPVLGCLMLTNIVLGMWYNIGVNKISFDYKILLEGIIRAAIIGGSFISLAYAFEATDLSITGVTPQLMINASIVLYAGKCITSFGKILGIKIEAKV